MQSRVAFLFLAGATFALIGIPVHANHGFAAYSSEGTTVQATITEFRFINPHVQVYFDVSNEAGDPEAWQAELTAPNKLARAGWTKNTLKPGDAIVITGQIARNDGRSIRIRRIITEDGKSLPIRETIDF